MDFSRTLIIKPSSMGDIVQALPVLTALKETRPEARVSWLVARPFAELLEDNPRLEEIISFDRKRFAHIAWNPGAMLDFIGFMRGLRRRRFTLVLDLQGLLRSGIFALSTGARTRVGFAAARELAPLFYTDRVAVPGPDTHAVDRYLRVARAVGLNVPKEADHLPVAPAQRQRARALLAKAGLGPNEPFAVVGADARWPTKLWPPQRFARVIDQLWAEAGARSVLIGGADAKPSAEEIRRFSGHAPIDLTARTTLKELVGVIAEARVMVTNDSGPMHVAAAVGTPAVAIFGPTNPLRTGPYGPGHRVVTAAARCRPCYRRQCVMGGAEAMACMAGVAADEVAAAALEAWRRRGA
jgi:lipopolysaccharide heptosyltransferase I